MLPSAGGTANVAAKKAGGQNWLKVDHLTKQPKEAKILMVRSDADNRFGPRVNLKIAMDGQVYFYGINIKGNPDYQALLERFGQDENEWVDKKILLHAEQDEFTDKFFPRVTFPTGKK